LNNFSLPLNIFSLHLFRWALRIQEVKVADAGGYECQVTTANKTNRVIVLNVLGERVRESESRLRRISLGRSHNMLINPSSPPPPPPPAAAATATAAAVKGERYQSCGE